jgi:hypothetical protein
MLELNHDALKYRNKDCVFCCFLSDNLLVDYFPEEAAIFPSHLSPPCENFCGFLSRAQIKILRLRRLRRSPASLESYYVYELLRKTNYYNVTDALPEDGDSVHKDANDIHFDFIHAMH